MFFCYKSWFVNNIDEVVDLGVSCVSVPGLRAVRRSTVAGVKNVLRRNTLLAT